MIKHIYHQVLTGSHWGPWKFLRFFHRPQVRVLHRATGGLCVTLTWCRQLNNRSEIQAAGEMADGKQRKMTVFTQLLSEVCHLLIIPPEPGLCGNCLPSVSPNPPTELEWLQVSMSHLQTWDQGTAAQTPLRICGYRLTWKQGRHLISVFITIITNIRLTSILTKVC